MLEGRGTTLLGLVCGLWGSRNEYSDKAVNFAWRAIKITEVEGAVWPRWADVSYAMRWRHCLAGALSEGMDTRSAWSWWAIGSFFSSDSVLSACLTSQGRAIRKYINMQEKMLLRVMLHYFYLMKCSRQCLGKMNFVKLMQSRVEWLASKTTSLKQPCSSLDLRAARL